MKAAFYTVLFMLCISMVCAQPLRNPTFDRFGTQNSGNILLVNRFNEIWKSDIRCESILELQKMVDELRRESMRQATEIKELHKEIHALQDMVKHLQDRVDKTERTNAHRPVRGR